MTHGDLSPRSNPRGFRRITAERHFTASPQNAANFVLALTVIVQCHVIGISSCVGLSQSRKLPACEGDPGNLAEVVVGPDGFKNQAGLLGVLEHEFPFFPVECVVKVNAQACIAAKGFGAQLRRTTMDDLEGTRRV